MEKKRTKNLTEGSPVRLLLGFIGPLLIGYLFQQFYSIVDAVVVGKLLGADALAGVGSTGAVNFLILGFCMGICSGFAIPVAQKFGQQDLEGLRRIVGNILWLGIFFSVVITIPISLLCSRILVLMNTPEETFHYAYIYILIIFLGIPSAILYNLVSGILRSLGDSRTPLYFLILSSLLNVALDLILIIWGKMGVAGAAVATVASQLVSGLLSLIFMMRHFPILRLSRDDLRLRREECMRLLSMGIPMGLQYSITAIGSTILQAAVNGLGAASMAAVTAGGRAFSLIVCPTDAIGTAAATFAGQNVGARKLRRVHAGTAASFCIGSVYAILAYIGILFFGKGMLSMFLNPGDPATGEILELGQQFLRANAFSLIPLLCVNLFRFTIQGMGFSKQAIIAGILELIARAVLSLVMVPIFGFSAVCWAAPAAWVLADLFLIPMYFLGMRYLGYRKNDPKQNSV